MPGRSGKPGCPSKEAANPPDRFENTPGLVLEGVPPEVFLALSFDFDELAGTVGPYIERTGGIAGILIETPVTDSALGQIAERLASHFVSAEIKRFPAAGLEEARRWVMGR